MNKELEALKILKANAILFDDGTDFGASMLEAINDLDIYLTQQNEEENDSKVYLKGHSLINLASGDYTSLDLEHENNKYFITGFGDGEATLEISYETAVKIIKDLRWGVSKWKGGLENEKEE